MGNATKKLLRGTALLGLAVAVLMVLLLGLGRGENATQAASVPARGALLGKSRCR